MWAPRPLRMWPSEIQMLYCSLNSFVIFTAISSSSTMAQMFCACRFFTTGRGQAAAAMSHGPEETR